MFPAMLAHEVCREILHCLAATFHRRASADENPRLFAADTGELFFDLPVPFSPGRRARVTVDRSGRHGKLKDRIFNFEGPRPSSSVSA